MESIKTKQGFRMWQGIRTFFLVSFITCLVWLYAESEVVKQHEIDLDVRFVPPAAGQLQVEPTEPQRFHVVFRSTNSVNSMLDRQTRPHGLTIEVPDDAKPDGQARTLTLKDALASTPPFKDLGLTILEVQPPTFDVHVTHLVTRKLHIGTPKVEGVELASCTFDPAEVEVTAPLAIAQTWDKNLELEARLDRAALVGVSDDQPHTFDVTVDLPAAYRHAKSSAEVVFARTTASMTVTIRKRTARYTVTSIPVWASWPPDESKLVSIDLGDDQKVLHNITLTGPADAIDRIKSGQTKLTATVLLTADDLETAAGKEAITVQPSISNLPAGVAIESPTPLPAVKLRVTKKAPDHGP